MKIEMPQEPDVDRLWTKNVSGVITEWERTKTAPGWTQVEHGGFMTWRSLRGSFDEVYTEHPDLDALECLPTPWEMRNGGTIVDANGKVIMEATVRCTSGRNRLVGSTVNRLIVRLVNEFAAQQVTDTGEDEKR